MLGNYFTDSIDKDLNDYEINNERTNNMETEKATNGKKKLVIQETTTHQKVAIKKKNPLDWMNLIRAASTDHWRSLIVTIKIREKIMAGKPAQLDAAEAMLKARGLESAIEAVNIDDPNALAAAAEKTVDEGLCEFHRREGKPGLWMPSNNLKAMLKENWSVLGYNKEHRGSKGALAEGVFVFGADVTDGDWVYLGEKADGIDTMVCHTTGPRGPMSSIKRHEYMLQPTIAFRVKIANAIAEKLPDDAFARVLYHASEHGVGACRSQGFGRFDIVNVIEEGCGNPEMAQ